MRFVVVTGMSGGGKLTAIRFLEDMGYYCVDNLPVRLIDPFMALVTAPGSAVDKVVLGMDVRADESFDNVEQVLAALKEKGYRFEILFMDASDEVLVKRYKETRRAHPVSPTGRVEEGIAREREMLKDIRAAADYILDTSNVKTAQFWAELRQLLTSGESQNTFMVNVMSFGFKNGTPASADIIFDTRFIPNPYYVQSLRRLTGNNKKVSHYVLKHEITQEFLKSVMEMVEKLMPFYMKEGKYSLNIGIGCTGGHHRSVAVANEIYHRLREKGFRATIDHRDL